MQIQKDISLKPYNTFGIDVKASRFINITSLDILTELVNNEKDFFILGGGSNLLLTKDIDKLVVHINFKGIKVIEEFDNSVLVQVAAGEVWHEFVLWCIDHDFGGVENLSLIPGNVGTAPIQNIGAYGVEFKDTVVKVEALHIETGEVRIFKKDECHFGYRNSVFKNDLKGDYIITNVIFKLSKNKHTLNSSYGAIQAELAKNNISEPTIKAISDAVIAIRQSKLPDPKKIGNSGSFFKNPVISKSEFEKLQEKFPNTPFYEVKSENSEISILKSEILYKVPAGWMVEQCGYKGKRYGDAGIHKNQALVLVNYGNATGKEILDLSKRIQKSVFEKFGIAIEAEVNII